LSAAYTHAEDAKKIPIDVLVSGRDQQMGVDQHRQRALRAVGLDVPHATHVGGQIEHPRRTTGRHIAGRPLAQVEPDVLDIRKALAPLLERLDVHGPDPCSPSTQVGDQVAADESAAGDDDEIVTQHAR
jgi:hypothetical protein